MPMMSTTFPASVASVMNLSRVVINRGAEHGVKYGQRFAVYALSEEDIVDPVTKESLGRLEIIKGIGKVVHIQDKISILEAMPESTNVLVFDFNPKFKDPVVGDKARPV